MLADKDRIFTNLYGMNDRTLKGAQQRSEQRTDDDQYDRRE